MHSDFVDSWLPPEKMGHLAYSFLKGRFRVMRTAPIVAFLVTAPCSMVAARAQQVADTIPGLSAPSIAMNGSGDSAPALTRFNAATGVQDDVIIGRDGASSY